MSRKCGEYTCGGGDANVSDHNDEAIAARGGGAAGSADPAAVYLGARQKSGPAVEAGSWGLSFQTPGQPPKADVTADQLREYDAKYIGDTMERPSI